ncbi:hypothetical protein LCGC14_1254840 [marine sediment metagenome]|uniref:Uncharacterized protein n=1 Tax=marine sediment metagenome TaxID=412755 RepID=A0A0F9L5B0_9ZZZZ
MKINNILFIGLVLFFFGVGIFVGIPLGMKAGQMILFEGINIGLKDSNIDITIDVNESTLVNEVNKTIVPYFIEEIRKSEKEVQE